MGRAGSARRQKLRREKAGIIEQTVERGMHEQQGVNKKTES